jgi:glycosyltransferase involved in cell wall biosynthesis
MVVSILTNHYPPDQAVGARRPAALARVLAARGHEVQIFAPAVPGTLLPGQRFDPDGTSVITLAVPPSPRDVLLRLLQRRRRVSISSAGEPGGTSASVAAPTRQPALKRWLLSLLWLPDDRQGLIAAAVHSVLPFLRRRGGVLVTTAPPFSVHVAGSLLQFLSGRPWIADYRDPWTNNPDKPDFVRSVFSDAADRWLERVSLRRAAQVVCSTESLAAELEPRMPLSRPRPEVIRNGISAPAPTAPNGADRGTAFLIIHTGTLYLGRDPEPFLLGLAEFVARRRLGARDLRVEFIGDAKEYLGRSVPQRAAELGLGDIVTFPGQLPHPECMDRQTHADAFLLLAQGQPSQVPHKLYEYLGARRPILALADEVGESARLLRRGTGHEVITSWTPSAVVEALERVMERGASPTPPHPDGNAWSAEVQMSRFAELIEGVDELVG